MGEMKSVEISEITMDALKKLMIYLNFVQAEHGLLKSDITYDSAIYNAVLLANLFYEDKKLRGIFKERFVLRLREAEEEARRNKEEQARKGV
jgi:hypothetical protein